MDIRKQFEYNPEIEVAACQIGIGKWDWVTIEDGNAEKAKEMMLEFRYDVLPVVNKNGKIHHYFSTHSWNDYRQIDLKEVDNAPTVYYRTSLKDLVRKFKEEQKHYYFLTDYQEVLGLVSPVNLNCQLVYNYLFFVISDIERSVSSVLKKYVSPDQILERFEKSKDSHQNSLVDNYREAIDQNSDTDLFQMMYLQSIGIVLKKFSHQLPQEISGLAAFYKRFAANEVYGRIRNKVMHPVRPLLSDQSSLSDIHQLLSDYTEIKEMLA